MNTPPGPNLTDLETIHSRDGSRLRLLWRSGGHGPQPCGVATRYTPRVDAGKGTAYAVERPEWRSLHPHRNKHWNRAPQRLGSTKTVRLDGRDTQCYKLRIETVRSAYKTLRMLRLRGSLQFPILRSKPSVLLRNSRR